MQFLKAVFRKGIQWKQFSETKIMFCQKTNSVREKIRILAKQNEKKQSAKVNVKYVKLM